MTVDPVARWVRREVRKEILIGAGVGLVAAAVVGLFIAGLVVIW